MSDQSRGRSVGVVLVTLAIVLVGIAAGLVPTSVDAQDAEAALECAEGTGGGPFYVTDNGLEVTDNDSAADEAYPEFPDDETVVLGGAGYDNVSFEAPGEASVRLEERNGSQTCLATVNATETDVTVAPDGATNVTLNGSFDAFAYRAIDFEAADAPDLTTDTNESVSVIVHDTGLDDGETVTVESLESDAIADEYIVDAEGRLSLEIAAGAYQLAVSTTDSDDGNGGGGGLPPPPSDDEPASFEVSGLDVDGEEFRVGEPATVTATVTNVGDETGSHTLALAVDGEVVGETSVTLDGGESKTVSLSTTLDAAGTVVLSVNGETVGTVEVTAPDESDDGDDSGESDEGDDRTDDRDGSGDSDEGDDRTDGDESGESDDGDDRSDGDGIPGFGAVGTLFALGVLTLGRLRV